MLKEHGQGNSEMEGGTVVLYGTERSCQISGTGFKSAGRGHGRTRQHGVVVPNLWVKFSKCRIFARDDSPKFLISCFWYFYRV